MHVEYDCYAIVLKQVLTGQWYGMEVKNSINKCYISSNI